MEETTTARQFDGQIFFYISCNREKRAALMTCRPLVILSFARIQKKDALKKLRKKGILVAGRGGGGGWEGQGSGG